jgi:glycosyltransferase involved in cell wall biosynthesis
MSPSLSIIIPAYNAEKFLQRCLDSLAARKADDFEVLVVNDGSTDGTGQKADAYAAKDPRFRAVHQENGGVSVARKNGVSLASGPYIWFIDSDDYLLPDALGKVLALIKDHPETDTFFAPVQMRDEQDGKEWVKPYAQADETVLSGKDYLKRKPVSVCPVQFVFRKTLLENPWVFFPEGLRHEDEYFCRVLQYFSPSLYILDEPLYVYCQWGGSFMNTSSIRHLYDMVEVYRYLNRFVEEGAAPEDRPWLQPDIFSFLISTHFWYRDLFRTQEFKAFRRANIGFIRQEFQKAAPFLPAKERRMDRLMLTSPNLLATLLKWKAKL